MTLKIDQAFTQTILSGGLAIDLVHENGLYSQWGGASYTSKKGPYTPGSNTTGFAELANFPAGIDPLSLNDTDEATGFYQVIVKYPADGGSIAAKTKADEVLALFPLGTAITYSSQKVYPTTKSLSSGRVDGGFYQITVRVNYRAFLTR